MEYLKKSFSVSMSSKAYNDNYDKIFRKPLLQKIKDYIEKYIYKLLIKE